MYEEYYRHLVWPLGMLVLYTVLRCKDKLKGVKYEHVSKSVRSALSRVFRG